MKIFGSISELVDLAFRLAGGKQVKIRSNPQTTPGSTITVNVPDVYDSVAGATTGDTQNMVLTAAKQSLSNKILTSPVVNTPTISGGTINNTHVGQTTPATGAFTTLTSTSTTQLEGTGLKITNLNTGVAHIDSSTGAVSSSLIVDGDITPNTISAGSLASIGAGNILIGANGSGYPSAQAVTGDITITSLGVTAISSEVIVNTDISPGAAINRSKLAAGDSYRIVSNDNAGAMTQNESLVVEKALVSTPTADRATKGPVTTSSTTAAQIALLDDLNALKGKVQAQIDSKQAADVTLTAIAGVSTDADKYIYFTGVDEAVAGTITSFGRSLVDDADNTAARSTLGLGSMATQAAGSVTITGGSLTGVALNNSTLNRLTIPSNAVALNTSTYSITNGVMVITAASTASTISAFSYAVAGDSLANGTFLTLINDKSSSVTIENNASISTGTGDNFTLASKASVNLVYSSTVGKWVLNGGAGGAGGGLTTSPLATTLSPAVKNTHYLTNTSGGAFSVTLPAGTAGSVIRFSDANETWDSNALTITPATGEKLDNLATNESLICDVKRGWVELSWNTALSSWSFQSLSATNVVEASAAQAGVVSTGAQTFAGVKTFQDGAVIKGSTTGVAPAAGYVGETIVKYATANTGFSTFTTTDITGATQTLGAGTWLLLIRCGGYASSTGGNANFDIVLRDSANTLIVQNTANWTSGPLCGLPGSVPATVTIPAGNTVTYKMGLASASQGATGCGGAVLANLTSLTCVRIA